MQKILAALVANSFELTVRESIDRPGLWYAGIGPAGQQLPAPGSVEGFASSPELALAALESQL
jgi:hypothetical protein